MVWHVPVRPRSVPCRLNSGRRAKALPLGDRRERVLPQIHRAFVFASVRRTLTGFRHFSRHSSTVIGRNALRGRGSRIPGRLGQVGRDGTATPDAHPSTVRQLMTTNATQHAVLLVPPCAVEIYTHCRAPESVSAPGAQPTPESRKHTCWLLRSGEGLLLAGRRSVIYLCIQSTLNRIHLLSSDSSVGGIVANAGTRVPARRIRGRWTCAPFT